MDTKKSQNPTRKNFISIYLTNLPENISRSYIYSYFQKFSPKLKIELNLGSEAIQAKLEILASSASLIFQQPHVLMNQMIRIYLSEAHTGLFSKKVPEKKILIKNLPIGTTLSEIEDAFGKFRVLASKELIGPGLKPALLTSGLKSLFDENSNKKITLCALIRYKKIENTALALTKPIILRSKLLLVLLAPNFTIVRSKTAPIALNFDQKYQKRKRSTILKELKKGYPNFSKKKLFEKKKLNFGISFKDKKNNLGDSKEQNLNEEDNNKKQKVSLIEKSKIEHTEAIKSKVLKNFGLPLIDSNRLQSVESGSSSYEENNERSVLQLEDNFSMSNFYSITFTFEESIKTERITFNHYWENLNLRFESYEQRLLRLMKFFDLSY